ncbi:type VI secretion system baseplate subunit TssE [Niveibacterium sp. SC-1]|uniref:type VI secretion system baseplate subunit TssE n=1 Tax=Niveibacterium sp. SC-1 TaxID=3135646 RepID=UPI0031203D31
MAEAPVRRRNTSQGGARDEFLPAVLDRLSSSAPGRAEQGANPHDIRALRVAVLRDLGWLLNTTSLDATTDLSAYEHVSRSVLNFGVPPLAGKRISELNSQDLAFRLREAIQRFEPRLIPDSLDVRCLTDIAALEHRNVLAFEIQAQLWATPYPVAFRARSDLDLETGHVLLQDLVEG